MPKRVDRNQKEITDALRRVGATVTPTHALGKGFPDLCVGFRGVNYLFEIKDPMQPPSKRKLTPDELEWHQLWSGQVRVVFTIEEAFKVIGLAA